MNQSGREEKMKHAQKIPIKGTGSSLKTGKPNLSLKLKVVGDYALANVLIGFRAYVSVRMHG